MKIPQHSQVGSTKFLIDGHVRPHTAGAHERYVAAARVRAGSLESSEPFEVSADGQRSRVDPHGTMFVDENGVTLRGWIDSEDLKLWGPDARVQLAVGNATVNIERHTEGRGETSRAMLDLSMSGLTDMG